MNLNSYEKEVFFYFIWGKEYYWNNLIISLCLLRKKYPDNKIVVVSYTKDVPKYFLKYSNKIKFNFIVTECYFEKKYKNSKVMGPTVQDLDNFCDTHRKLSSKVIDCIEIAQDKEKVILLDTDVFVIKKFNNINWDKIGVYIIGKYNFNNKNPKDYVVHSNTGVMTFQKSSENTNKLKELFIKEIDDLASGAIKQSDYIIKTCGESWLDWRCRGLAESLKTTTDQIKKLIEKSNIEDGFWIQEEMITRMLIDKYENLFHNITLINNGFIFLEGDKRTENPNQITKYNNLHLFNFLNYNIGPLIMHINYFRKKIIKDIEENHIINYVLPSHLTEIANKINKYLSINKKII